MSSNDQLTTNEYSSSGSDDINNTQINNLEATEAEIRANTITSSFGSLATCGCNPVCPICPTGATGPVGPTGATGATGAATQIRGLEVQLQGEATSVASTAPVLFDTVVSPLAAFIAYPLPPTGTITITDTGVFYINWWISTDGMTGGNDLVPTFAIITSLGQTIRGSSPIQTGKVSGNALISVVASPVTLQLINVTDSTIGFGATPVKADLTIIYVTF